MTGQPTEAARLAMLETLARNLLDPEMYGWAVTAEVRDSARRCLGIEPCETGRLRKIPTDPR